MAGHVFDGTPAPPELSLAWDFDRFGVDVMHLHPATLRSVKTALYAYNALHGYRQSAPNTAAWIARNTEAYNFVTQVLAERKRHDG